MTASSWATGARVSRLGAMKSDRRAALNAEDNPPEVVPLADHYAYRVYPWSSYE